MSKLHFIISADMQALQLAFLKVFETGELTTTAVAQPMTTHPFVREWILTEGSVQIEMLKQLLASESAATISSAVTFPYLENWVEALEEILQKISPMSEENSPEDEIDLAAKPRFRQTPYGPETLTWVFMRIFNQLLAGTLGQKNKELRPLINYLTRLQTPEARQTFATDLAHVFDRYILNRVDWLTQWEDSRLASEGLSLAGPIVAAGGASLPGSSGVYAEIAAWQRWLWRHTVKLIGGEHKIRRLAKLADRLESVSISSLRRYMPRLFLFNLATLPPHYQRLITVLAEKIAVYYFKWDVGITKENIRFLTDSHADVPTSKANNLVEAYAFSNALGLGKRRDDFIQIMNAYFFKNIPPKAHPQVTLPTREILSSAPRHSLKMFQEIIQSSTAQAILEWMTCLDEETNLRTKLSQATKPSQDLSALPLMAATPKRIVFYQTQQVYREVEQLHEHLVALFVREPTLKPSDVCLAAPDIGRYEPFIRSIFARTPIFPIAVARKSQGTLIAPVLNDFIRLLTLLAKIRWTNQDFEEWLQLAFIQNSMASADLSVVRKGFRAFFKTARLVRSQTGTLVEVTSMIQYFQGLSAGENEIFTGKKFSPSLNPEYRFTHDERWIVAGVLERLRWVREFQTLFKEEHSLRDWRTQFTKLTMRFLAGDSVAISVCQALEAIFEQIFRAGPELEQDQYSLDLMITALKTQWIESAPTYSTPYLSGGIICASMLHLRGLPVKVTCLLGLDKESFPRRSSSIDFDLVTSGNRLTDRAMELEDELLLLELISMPTVALFLSFSHETISPSLGKLPPDQQYQHFMSLVTAPIQRLLYGLANQLVETNLPSSSIEEIRTKGWTHPDTFLYELGTYLYEPSEPWDRWVPVKPAAESPASLPPPVPEAGSVAAPPPTKVEKHVWAASHTATSFKLMNSADIYFLKVLYEHQMKSAHHLVRDSEFFSTSLAFAEDVFISELNGTRTLLPMKPRLASSHSLSTPLQVFPDKTTHPSLLSIQTLRTFFDHPLKWYLKTHFQIHHATLASSAGAANSLEAMEEPLADTPNYKQFIEDQLRAQFMQPVLTRMRKPATLQEKALDQLKTSPKSHHYYDKQQYLLVERWEVLWEQVFQGLDKLFNDTTLESRMPSEPEPSRFTEFMLSEYTGCVKLSSQSLHGTVTNLVIHPAPDRDRARAPATALVHVFYQNPTLKHWISWFLDVAMLSLAADDPSTTLASNPLTADKPIKPIVTREGFRGALWGVRDPGAKSDKPALKFHRLNPLPKEVAKALLDYIAAWCAYGQRVPLPLFYNGTTEIMELFLKQQPKSKSNTNANGKGEGEAKREALALGDEFFAEMLEVAKSKWEEEDSHPSKQGNGETFPNHDYALNTFFFTDLTSQSPTPPLSEAEFSRHVLAEQQEIREATTLTSADLTTLHFRTTYYYFYKILDLVKDYLES